MAVKDFVVKNGLQVQSNVVVGAYTNLSTPIQNGMIVSGNVGIGTSTVTAGARLEVQGGNVKIGTAGASLMFPDGTMQTTAATATSPGGNTGAVQYRTADGGFGGDATKFFYDSTNYRLAIGASDTSTATLNVVGSVPSLFNTGTEPQIIAGTSSTVGTTLGYNTGSTYGYLRSAPTGNDMLRWNATGVGISNVTPLNSLDVNGKAVIGVNYAGAVTAPTSGLLVEGAVAIGSSSAGTMKFSVNGGTSTFSGNVGIGTTSTTGITAGNVFAVFGDVQVSGSINNATWNGQTIGVAKGGTGLTSYAVGDIVYASGTTTLASLADIATGSALISGGVGVAPSYGKIGLTTHISGTLGPTNGGTGLSSFAANSLLYASGANTWAALATANTSALVTNGSGVPAYTLGTTANRVLRTDGTTVSFAQVALTTDVSGTLPVANGGTNSSTASGTALDNITGFSGTGLMRRTGAGTYTFGTAVGLTSEVTGILPLANGGTNAALTASNGGIAWSNATQLQILSASATSGNVLISGGAGTPSWGQSYTASNLPSTLVSRDSSGNFSAGTITAATGLTVSAGGVTVTGASQITGNLTVTGNLFVTGAVNTVSSNVLVVDDPLIYIGRDNPSNNWDLGLVGSYNSGTYYHTGIARNKTDGVWSIFDTLVTEPNATTGAIDWASATNGSFKSGNVIVSSTLASTDSTTGALRVSGGAGIAGALNVGGANSTFTGDVAVNGGDITTSSGTATLFNTNATTLSVGQAATTLNLGATTGTLTVGNPTVVGTQTTQTLYNTTATTMNFAGAATALNMGATTGTLTVGNPTVVGTQATQALYNTTATTMNFAGAATTISVGAVTGTTTFNSATTSTASSNGAVKLLGGLGVAGNLNVGGTESYFTNTVGIGTTSKAGINSGNTAAVFGNSYVSGTIYANVGIVTPNVNSNTVAQTYTVDVSGTYSTGAAITQVVIDTFAGGTYRAAEYQISMKQGANYAISRITVIHDGTTAYLTEYDAATTNGFLVDFDATYNAGTIELKAAPKTATITEFKTSRKVWVI